MAQLHKDITFLGTSVPWTSPLGPLAETFSSGSTCPVLPFLEGTIGWGEDQHGANQLGYPVRVATEIVESRNKNTQVCIKRQGTLLPIWHC